MPETYCLDDRLERKFRVAELSTEGDAAMALNVTALVVSLVAVIITMRQATYARQSNHLPFDCGYA